MLNKQVCKRCINIHDADDKWHEADDERWFDQRRVCCPTIQLGKDTGRASTLKAPPDYCPYELEHVVSKKHA
jgi:hypothetical protein